MRDRALVDLGLTFRQYGELTPREVALLYERRRLELERKQDDMVRQAWWDGLFARAAFHADEYPQDVREFLPSLAEQRAEEKRRERESWTIDDCYKAVGLR